MLGRLALATFLTGCGIGSDGTEFAFDLPEKVLTVDSTQWGLAPSSTFPEVPCGGMEEVCASGPLAVCATGGSCLGSCEAGVCKAAITLFLFQRLELDREVPELELLNRTPLKKLDIERVSYRIVENTFSGATPRLEIAVGSQNAITPGHPQAQLVGSIDAVPALELTDTAAVQFSSTGKRALSDKIKNYATPFNLILSGDLELQAGDPIPSGAFKVVVAIRAVAGL
jgi:hypothetical protein